MKKFIAAAAGLMLTGAMVSSAMAAVTLGGDARVRYYFQENYVNLADSDDAKFNSRVTLKFAGDNEYGAYARAATRWNVADWGADNQGSRELAFQYAYMGVPLGPVTFEGGKIDRHLTDMVENDESREGLTFMWSDDMNGVQFWYDQLSENNSTTGSSDEDSTRFALAYTYTSDMIDVLAAGFYYNDETDRDTDGFVGTVRVAQDFGVVSYSLDYAFVEEDITGSDDAGHMGYGVLAVPTGEAGSIALVAGFTDGGAVMDAPIGFTMFAGDTQITPSAIGKLGQVTLLDIPTGEVIIGDDGVENIKTADQTIQVDTLFVGLKASYQIGEKSTIGGTVAYADWENDSPGGLDIDGWEVGASYKYAIAANTTFSGIIGYCDIDGFDDQQFGLGLNLDIKF